MSRHFLPEMPHANDPVVIKTKALGNTMPARWTGMHWQLIGEHYLPKDAVECWWPIPTEDQLDSLNDDGTLLKHNDPERMGAFFVGDDIESGCLIPSEEVLEDGNVIPDYDDPMNWEIGPGAENG